jgi:hypothetical protein
MYQRSSVFFNAILMLHHMIRSLLTIFLPAHPLLLSLLPFLFACPASHVYAEVYCGCSFASLF